MKIEIGESIIYSWLRHIKNCSIVQLNWKTSPEWAQETNLKYNLQSIMDRANIEFNNPFKKTNNLSQLFKQAEIDAIGINISTNTIYATDIAFHENGLSYGDKYETAKRITKKIIRTILLLQQYFSAVPNHRIIFVSPKINPEPLKILKSEILRISDFLKKESINCSILLISNDRFQDEILTPITNLSKNVADTSELFLRSIQLVNLFKLVEKPPQVKPVISGTNQYRKRKSEERQNRDESTLEINKVRRKVPKWFQNPNQINSTILIAYLNLAIKCETVTEQMIKNECQNISDFKGNFNQMKNFGEKNHGKVFEDNFGNISLWEPVKKFVLNQYKAYENI